MYKLAGDHKPFDDLEEDVNGRLFIHDYEQHIISDQVPHLVDNMAEYADTDCSSK